ncbi:MAG TPA: LuxR C-terminal-related transcriptional regulator, partial [Caldilineaceae bacterium]|nr:LuxR C-terminal-related transcriptional regulator [Caldilineaceae bacterium]
MNEALSVREIEILRLGADGSTNGEIASQLSLSLHTVKWYSRRIYEKLAVENRTQAIKRAQTLGMLDGSIHPAPPAPTHHNLPGLLTAFVGRRTEIDAVKQLLKQHRLLTLTGP